MALVKFTIREIRSRPGRAILTLLSVVIGVAMIVSVNVAAQTTRRANKDMYETLAGKASLEVMAEAGVPFDQAELDKVAKVDDVVAAVPLIRFGAKMTYLPPDNKPRPAPNGADAAEEPAEVAEDEEGVEDLRKQVDAQILGIDPDKDEAVRDYVLIAGKRIDKTKNKILMDNNFASGLGLKVHETVRFLVKSDRRSKSKAKEFTIVGLISPRGAAAIGQGVIYMSLESAQHLLFPLPPVNGKPQAEKKIHSIQVVTADGADLDRVREDISKIVAQGLVVRSPAMRTDQANETLLSTELGLNLATVLSFFLAFLIVLNTFQMNVAERRRQLAILRAIGATRGQIMGLIFREGLGMGVIGTAVGLLAGIGGAQLISKAMAKAMQTGLPPMEIHWQPLVIAACVGPLVSVLGALWPAWRAGRLTPLEGMGAVTPGEMEAPRLTLFALGTLTFAIGCVLLTLCNTGYLPVDGSVLSALTILLGLVLMIPTVLRPLTKWASTLLSPVLRVEGRLAEGQIVRRRGRTTLTVAVLFLAVAFGIGMAINIVNNVADVKNWAKTTITGDYFLRGMTFSTKVGAVADVPEEIRKELEAIPGIHRVLTVRYAETRVDKIPVSIIVGQFGEQDGRQLELVEGNTGTLQKEMEEGNAVIGTVLASRAKLKLGDTIPLQVLKGQNPPKVVGIANEYMAGGLAIHMRPKPAAEQLGITGLNAYVIKTKPGHIDEVGVALKSVAQNHGLLLQTQRELLATIDNIMAGLVGCLWLLLVLVFVVAGFGVVNTLTMNVIEQTRELGLLRIVAMTRNQVRKLIVSQATLLASIGLVPGVAAGLALAWFMKLSLQTVAGREIDFELHPPVVVGCFAVAFCIVLVAAWFPANRAAKLKLAEALQYQ